MEMVMRQYYFFRHGKADSALGDRERPLTELGVEAVKKQAVLLNDVDIDLVFCSVAVRTQQTADYLLAGRNPPRVVSDNLWHPVDASLRNDVDRLVDEVSPRCLADLKGQDTHGVYMRYAHIIAKELKDAIDKYDAKHVLVVGHCVIINALAMAVFPAQEAVFSPMILSTAQGFSFQVGGDDPVIVFS